MVPFDVISTNANTSTATVTPRANQLSTSASCPQLCAMPHAVQNLAEDFSVALHSVQNRAWLILHARARARLLGASACAPNRSGEVGEGRQERGETACWR